MAKVNLIPLSPVDHRPDFKTPPESTMLMFLDVLMKNRVQTMIRRSRGKESQAAYDISLENDYTANDHGEEYFTGTDVAPTAVLMYGVNLRNKLERDVLTISQQTLTDAQKAQVKQNIGCRFRGKRRIGYSYKYASLANNASMDITASQLGLSAPEGYEASGVYSVVTGDSGVVLIGYRAQVTGSEWAMRIRNVSGAALTNKSVYMGVEYTEKDPS